jgi:hypothetical protein
VDFEKELVNKIEDIKNLRSALLDSKAELERNTTGYETVIVSLI